MAHSGDGTGWDIAAPADADLLKDGAKEIRDLRTGVGIRVDKEHVAPAGSSAGGEHEAGSAKAYSTGTAPVNRPDAATALGAGDAGRLWNDTTGGALTGSKYSLKVWTGTAWVLASTLAWGTVVVGDSAPGTGAYSGYKTLEFVPKVLVFSDPTQALNFVVRCPTSGTSDANPYVCHKVAGGVITAVTYIVDVDFTNKRFRVKIGTVVPAPDDNTLRYAAFA